MLALLSIAFLLFVVAPVSFYYTAKLLTRKR